MKAFGSPRLITVLLVAAMLGGCSLGPGSSATAAPIPKVAMMHVGTDHNPPSLATLVARLGELGWFDGSPDKVMSQLDGDGTSKVAQDGSACTPGAACRMQQLSGEFVGPRIDLIWRNLDKGQVQDQAQEFVNQGVSVIVAFEDKSIAAAQTATANDPIPVVFMHPSDPVRDGLVQSLSHPNGNLTGVFGARDPVVTQLQLYKQIMPGLQRLLTLVDPTDTVATPPLLSEAQTAAAQLGIELDIKQASDQAELNAVFEAVTPDEYDGAFILSPSLRLTYSGTIIPLSTAAGLPVQAHRKEWVQQGALFSVGVDVGPVGTAAGRFVDAILHGTAPADLPVQEVPRVEFALNLEVAAALHITVAQDVQGRADVVYQ